MPAVSKTNRNSVSLLLVLVIGVGLISYKLLFLDAEKVELTATTEAEFNQAKQATNNTSANSYEQKKSSVHPDIAASASPDMTLALKLLGVVVSDDVQQSSATIESMSIIRTYYLNDHIAATDVVLVEVSFDRVVVRNEANEELVLILDNSAPDAGKLFTDEPSITTAEQQALAKSIGNRPEKLEHIVTTTPLGSSEGSDGFAVTPGLNPSLFRSAGFREGDVLTEINGLDLTVPEQYALAMAAIPNAHTLEFTVIRGGRIITLFLDVPSEGLSMGG